jgi:ABC-type glutathione transport system ATPase component
VHPSIDRADLGRGPFRGDDVLAYSKEAMRQARRQMQIVFQDPYSSLNPRMRVREIIEEPLVIHSIGTRESRTERVVELYRLVGLDPATLDRYPHEFSGGQRQRIGVARALALNPSFIIADEPVSALDVSIQAQVVNLLIELQQKLGSPTSSSPTIFVSSSTSAGAPRSCIWAASSRWGTRRCSSTTPGTRTRRRCSRRFPFPIPITNPHGLT